MKVAIAQINTILGDYQGNAEKIIEYSIRALEKDAQLVVFPEMTLFGYPAYDLLRDPQQVEDQLKVIRSLVKKIPKNITAVLELF